MAGYILRWFTRPHMVTHTTTNRAQHGVTVWIETNLLAPSHASALQQVVNQSNGASVVIRYSYCCSRCH